MGAATIKDTREQLQQTAEALGYDNNAMHSMAWLCRSYDALVAKRNGLYGVSGVDYSAATGAAPAAGRHSDPTAAIALRAARLSRKIDAVDKALKETTDTDVLRALLKCNVTQDVAYEYMAVPCGRRQFYALRREFFMRLWLLLEDAA